MTSDRTTERGRDGARQRREPHRPEELDALLDRAFEGEPVPRLSPGFEARLERRLAEEGRHLSASERRLPARARWLLALYWVVAAAACAVVLASSEPMRGVRLPLAWPALVTLLVTVAALALPYAALRRTGVSWTAVLRRALGW